MAKRPLNCSRPSPPARRRGVLIFLIVATIVFGLSLLPAAMAVLMSPMAFDAGPSREAWTMAIIIWAYPVLVILGLLLAWILYASRSYRTAILCCLLPLLDVAAVVVLLLLEM